MNEREALKTIRLVLQADLNHLVRMFDTNQLPRMVQSEIDKVNNAIKYIEAKTVELNEKDYPKEMEVQE